MPWRRRVRAASRAGAMKSCSAVRDAVEGERGRVERWVARHGLHRRWRRNKPTPNSENCPAIRVWEKRGLVRCCEVVRTAFAAGGTETGASRRLAVAMIAGCCDLRLGFVMATDATRVHRAVRRAVTGAGPGERIGDVACAQRNQRCHQHGYGLRTGTTPHPHRNKSYQSECLMGRSEEMDPQPECVPVERLVLHQPARTS